jgi:hypothetical protein
MREYISLTFICLSFIGFEKVHMKLKELESHLSNVENFTDAKEYLEQYMTTPHLGKTYFF